MKKSTDQLKQKWNGLRSERKKKILEIKNNADIKEIKFARNKIIIYDWKSGKTTVEKGRITKRTKWRAMYGL
jgi:hypothetical protein